MKQESLGSCGVIYQLRKDGFMLKKIEKRPLAVSEEDWGLFSAEMTGP
jgi:hypothetical protein